MIIKNKINWAAIVVLFIAIVGIALQSCKTDDGKYIIKPSSDVSVALTPSASSIALDTTQAATATALTLSWNAADYGLQVSVIYTLEIDSMKGDFTNPLQVSLPNAVSQAYTKKALNTLALSMKLIPATQGQLKFRVKADVGAGYPTIYSQPVTINITPYSTKPIPKYPVPANLFLVGGATPGGWSNPVAVPSQQFTKIDDNTFGIVIQLTAGGDGYDFLPTNGSWGNKYNVANKANADGLGSAFQPSTGPGDDIPPPPTTGLYKIIVDFVKGTYTLTALTSNPVPGALYIVGDATPGGWANPVPTPSQQFTQVSNGEYQLTISLSSAGSYLLLPVNGSWDHKFGGTDKLSGTLLVDGNVPGANTPAPDGTYLIDVNFLSMTYTLTKQ